MASDNLRDIILAILAKDETLAATVAAGRNFENLKNKVDEVGTAGAGIKRKIEDGVEDKHGTIKQKFLSGLKDLPGAAKKLGDDVAESLGNGVISNIPLVGESLGKVVAAGGPYAVAAVGVVIALISPIIAGGIGAAITLGVGGGLLAAGILLLKGNKKIQDSFSKMKNDIASSLKGAADPLIVPLQNAMKTIGSFFKNNKNTFKQLFASIAPAVVPLTNALLGFVTSLLPGIESIAKTFADVVKDKSFSDMLSGIGHSISTIFQTISNHPNLIKDFFKALQDTVAVISWLINVFIDWGAVVATQCRDIKNAAVSVGKWFAGPFVNFFKDAWTWIKDAFHAAIQFLELGFLNFELNVLNVIKNLIHGWADAFGWVPGLGDKLKAADKTIGGFVNSIQKQIDSIHGKDITLGIDLKLTSGTLQLNPSQVFKGFAAGGLTPGGPVIVGENGPEIVDLPKNSRVYPHGTRPPAPSGGDLTINLGADLQIIIQNYMDEHNRRVIRNSRSGSGNRTRNGVRLGIA